MSTVKTWEMTSVQGLVRNQKSGRYYARTFSRGKQIWKALKTDHFSVAKARLADIVKGHREREETKAALTAGKMTVAEACEMRLKQIDNDLNMKPATQHYWRQISVALLKSWPALREFDVQKVTPDDCRIWAETFKKKASSTRFNNTVGFLRTVFALAVETGARFNNPAADLKRVRVRAKLLTLPNRKQFLALVSKIETAGAWCSRDCADFVRFLAFTGCRIGEAALVTWGDVEFDKGVLVVRGDAETGTKNWEVRRVPLIPDALALLQRMRKARADEDDTTLVLRVNEAQKAMDNAAERVDMIRITHHDLRHLFATTCIESGIDIPTVSRWLGHKDGGALAMKTYGHLRSEHSLAQAKKVSFAPQATA